MSEWTYVRIIYDLEVFQPKKEKDTFVNIGATQRFESVIDEDLHNVNDSLFSLGSERNLDHHFYGEFGSTEYLPSNMYLKIDDRGILVLTGNLRNCSKKEFIRRLNLFIKILYRYGLSIGHGLVCIR
jgi:hypothetical protein